MMIKKLGNHILPVIFIALIALFPSVVFYANNVDEMSFVEVIPIACAFLVIGILLYIPLTLITKKTGISSLCVVFLLLLIQNYRLIQSALQILLPSWRFRYLGIIIAIFTAAALLFILKKINAQLGANLAKIGAFVMAGLTVMNAAIAMPDIIRKTGYSAGSQNAAYSTNNSIVNADNKDTLPNVYLLIFDEYAGFDEIKKYYDYDNAELLNFLEESGFTISKNSFSSTSDTYRALANIYNLDYDTPSDMPREEKLERLNSGKLLDIMASLGYNIVQLQTSEKFYFPSLLDIKNLNAKSQTELGETSTQLLVRDTLFFPFEEQISNFFDAPKFVGSEGNAIVGEINPVLMVMDYLTDSENFPMENTFLSVYVGCPHTPFQFDRNGNMVDWNNRSNWTEPQYYLDQYIYISKRIQSAVENILNNDPTSIIILQSDHGARFITPDMDSQDRLNILNAVYWQGNPLPEILGHSHIDTERIVLSKTFGLDLPPLKEPSTDYISLEETGLKYKSEKSVRHEYLIYSSDPTWTQAGDTFTFSIDVQYFKKTTVHGWTVWDENFQVLHEEPYREDPSFTYTFDKPGKYWLIAKVRDQDNKVAEKLFASVEKNEGPAKLEIVDRTYAPLNAATFSIKQDGNAFTFTTDYSPDDPNTSFRWVVNDSNYKKLLATKYESSPAFTYTPTGTTREMIRLEVQYTVPGYSEKSVRSIASIAYNDKTQEFELQSMQ